MKSEGNSATTMINGRESNQSMINTIWTIDMIQAQTWNMLSQTTIWKRKKIYKKT